jgi:acyl-coenzyme A synthetase/AMP-(fatty) acid ligase
MEDGVEFLEDGCIVLLGRLDRIVKIEEKRLSLPEMESWLAQHSAVTAAAVAPVTIGLRTMVGAVVVAKSGHPDNRKDLVAALKAHLRQKYDDVLLPRHWRFVESLPYSERGKLAVEDLVALLSTPL